MNELFRKRKSTHKDKTVRLQMLAKQESLLSWSRNQEENAAALGLKGEERKSEFNKVKSGTSADSQAARRKGEARCNWPAMKMILIGVSGRGAEITTTTQRDKIFKLKKSRFCSTGLWRKIGQDREDRAVGDSSKVRGRVSGKEMRKGTERYQV